MVNIYIKQGRYQQALEILRKISLNNPKKSSNFAAQIYLLEVLLKENKWFSAIKSGTNNK